MIGGMFTTILLYASPIIICALGGMFSERSGIVNIALEGLMLFGAFTSATVLVLLNTRGIASGSTALWISIFAGGIVGLLFSSLHALASIRFKADQVISGTAVNLLASGLTVFGSILIFKTERTPLFSQYGFSKISIPLLSKIPYVKTFFTGFYPTIFLVIFIIILSSVIINKTRFGLRIKACGENPSAADSAGINVSLIRTLAILISGMFAGLAGSVMVLTQNSDFSLVAIHGYGFIALAALVFGKWRVKGVVFASLFFAFANMLQVYSKSIPGLSGFPVEFFQALPYLLTVIALIITSSKASGPKALGEAYDKGKR